MCFANEGSPLIIEGVEGIGDKDRMSLKISALFLCTSVDKVVQCKL